MSGIPPWLCWVFVLRLSYKTVMKLSARTAVISRHDWGKIHFQAYSYACWQASCPPWLFRSDMNFLPYGSSLRDNLLPLEQASKRMRRQSEPPGRKPQNLCNIIFKVKSYYFSYMVFIRSESLGSGDTYTRTYIPERGNSWGSLIIDLLQMVTSNEWLSWEKKKTFYWIIFTKSQMEKPYFLFRLYLSLYFHLKGSTCNLMDYWGI